jgi:hypothetical protein
MDGIPRPILTRAQTMVRGGLLYGPQPYRWLLRQAKINGIGESELLGAGWFWRIIWWQDGAGETIWSLPYETRYAGRKPPWERTATAAGSADGGDQGSPTVPPSKSTAVV